MRNSHSSPPLHIAAEPKSNTTSERFQSTKNRIGTTTAPTKLSAPWIPKSNGKSDQHRNRVESRGAVEPLPAARRRSPRPLLGSRHRKEAEASAQAAGLDVAAAAAEGGGGELEEARAAKLRRTTHSCWWCYAHGRGEPRETPAARDEGGGGKLPPRVWFL